MDINDLILHGVTQIISDIFIIDYDRGNICEQSWQ